MTISGISSAASSYATSQATSDTRSIEKQISELRKSITEIQNDDSLDDKTKNQKISVYQAQITRLQAELAKIKQKQADTAQANAGSQAEQQQTRETASGNRATGMFGIGQYIDQYA